MGTPSGLISICMPAYNKPESLREALDHILRQSYSNIEVIVSDDCSPCGEVRSVIAEYAGRDKRVKPFFQEKNIGPFNNQRFALDQAAGEYVMIHSDDDYIDENYIKTCYDFLRTHLDYSMACAKCVSHRLDKDGRRLKYYADSEEGKPVYALNNPALLTVDSPVQRCMNLFIHLRYYYLYFGLVRREVFMSLYECKCLSADRLFLSGVAFAGKIALLDEENSYFHRGGVFYSEEDYIEMLKLSLAEKLIPGIGVTYSAFMDVLFWSKTYQTLGFFKRLIFAGRLSFLAFGIFCIRPLMEKLLPRSFYERVRAAYTGKS